MMNKSGDMQEDPTGQKYGRLEEEGGMGPDKVDSRLIQQPTIQLFSSTLLLVLLWNLTFLCFCFHLPSIYVS